MVASENGFFDIVKIFLLFTKADVNMQDKDGWTALMLACQHGYTEIAINLIEYGADVNLMKNDGWTVLTLARMNHHADTVEVLIKYHTMDAITNKRYMYTSFYTTTGTEDSGYGHSAERHTLFHDKGNLIVNIIILLMFFSAWTRYYSIYMHCF